MQDKLPETLLGKWESSPLPTHDAFLPPITEFNEVWIALGGDAGIGTLQGDSGSTLELLYSEEEKPRQEKRFSNI